MIRRITHNTEHGTRDIKHGISLYNIGFKFLRDVIQLFRLLLSETNKKYSSIWSIYF